MAAVVVFHSALGLRAAVRRFADVLRADGHDVTTPDLFDGAVFDDLEAGAAMRDAIGIPELLRRATDAVEPLPDALVYAGFSMGAMPAELLAATRPAARGALLVDGAAALGALGLATWPDGVAVQVHTCAEDPWVDHDAVTALGARVPAACWQHRQYPGGGHLVSDRQWRDHDPDAAAAFEASARAWLATLDQQPPADVTVSRRARPGE